MKSAESDRKLEAFQVRLLRMSQSPTLYSWSLLPGQVAKVARDSRFLTESVSISKYLWQTSSCLRLLHFPSPIVSLHCSHLFPCSTLDFTILIPFQHLLRLTLPSASITLFSLFPSCIIPTSRLFGWQSQATNLAPNRPVKTPDIVRIPLKTPRRPSLN